MNQRPLSEFAPYTAYVFTIDYLFHNFLLPDWLKKKRSKVGSDWIDFNYSYYFPFIDIFITHDVFYTQEFTKALGPTRIPQGFFHNWRDYKKKGMTS